MSERAKILWIFSLAATAILFGLCGTHGGRLQGRAEQKKWDEGHWSSDGFYKIFVRDEIEEKDGKYIQRMVIESPNPLSLDGSECVVKGSEVTEGQ